jgi:hypothetical protein
MSDLQSARPPQMEAQDRLEDAVLRSTALLEGFAAIIELSDGKSDPRLSCKAVEGLQLLAMQEGANLRDRFAELCVKGRVAA